MLRRTREHVAELLAAKQREGVVRPGERTASELAHGERQILELALALLGEPEHDHRATLGAATAAARALFAEP